MDCTTDASHADQLSLIIRYLNDSYDITERLVNIQRVKDSSAKGLLATLRDILSKNSINLRDAVGQSYDGASVMRGKYNGLKSLIQKESSKCLFIWTFDHVLNLVIMEACSSSIAAKSLFGLRQEKEATSWKKSRKLLTFLKIIDHNEFLLRGGGHTKERLIMFSFHNLTAYMTVSLIP